MRATIRLAASALRRGHRAPLLMMFVVIMLAATGVAAALALTSSSAARIDGAFASASGPDMVVTSRPDQERAVIDVLSNDADVVEIGSSRPARAIDMRLDPEPSMEHLLSVPPDGGQRLGAPVIRSGRSPASADEITIDAAVADDLALGIGDTVSFVGGGSESRSHVDFEVVGTAYDFADCFHPSCDPARSWVTDKGLSRVGGPATSIIDVALSSAASAPAVEQHLVERVGDVGVNTWIDTRSDLLSELEFFAGFLGVFGIFVLVASAVVIAAALSARTLARRRNIGLAKAVGFTPAQLTLAIVVEHVAVALVAAASGWTAATLLVPHLRIGALAVIRSDPAATDICGLFVTVVIVIVVVLAATIGPAIRASHLPTIHALRDASVRSHRTGRTVARLTRGMPWSVAIGARRWASRPARSIAAVIALILALTAGIVSLAIDHSMDHLLANPEETGDPWDVALTPTSSSAGAYASLERQLDAMPEIDHWYTVVDRRAAVDGERMHVRELGGDPTAARYVIGAGRGLVADNEAIVGYSMLAERGWHIGQSIDVALDDHGAPFRIVGWYRETEDSGHVIQIRRSKLASGGERTYALTATSATDVEQLVSAVSALGEIDVNEPDGEGLTPFRVAMALMTLLVGAIVVSHLFATALVTQRLRANDDAALRAVGVPNRAFVSSAFTTAALSSSFAVALGVPVAWMLQRLIGDAITSAIGAGPGASPSPPLLRVTLFVGAVLVLATLVEIAAARRGRSTGFFRTE